MSERETTTSESPYDLKVLARLRLRRRLRFLARVGVGVTLLLLSTGGVTYYFYQMPRERAQSKLDWRARAKLGAKDVLTATTGSIVAPEGDPTQSKLPVVELFVTGSKLDALSKSLPESGDIFQKALLRADGKVKEVKVKHRGDSFNHWLYPYKSWRVKLTDYKTHRGYTTFNLNLPRTATQFGDEFGYELARRFGGFLVPKSELVHFRLNRQFNGMRMMIEQLGPSFFSRRGLRPGEIYVGDIDTQQIYGTAKAPQLFTTPAAWKVEGVDTDVGVADQKELPPRLVRLTEILKSNSLTPYQRLEELRELIDIDAFVSEMAFLELVGSWHIDNTHNQRIYLNPDNGKLTPILWDPVAYIWGATAAFDIPSNLLFARLLEIPSIAQKKNLLLTKAVRGEFSTEKVVALVDEYEKKTEHDIEASTYRISSQRMEIELLSASEWREKVQELRNHIRERNSIILSRLNQLKVSSALSPEHNAVQLKVDGRGAFLLNKITVKFDRPLKDAPRLERLGLNELGSNLKRDASTIVGQLLSPTEAEYTLSDSLYPYRKAIEDRRTESHPGFYTYRAELKSSGAKIVDFQTYGLNAALGNSLPVARANWKEKTKSGFWNPEDFTTSPERSLSGEVVINKPLVITGENVRIAPGTVLKISDGASLIIRNSSVRVDGSEKAPVRVESPTFWGSFALLNSEFRISGLNVTGGSFSYVDGLYLDAPVVVRGSKGEIANSTFNHAKLSVQDSTLQLTNVKLSGVAPLIEERNSEIAKATVAEEPEAPLMKMVPGPALGTPARLEREFKLSLSSFGDSGLKQLATEINTALRQTDTSGWVAPKLFGKSYGVSEIQSGVCYVDYYFDSPEQINLNNDAVYRMRYRHKSCDQYLQHLEQPENPDFWPYRVELQAKVNRKSFGEGFSEVEESRLEYRYQSKPFSKQLLPPPPPWDVDYMMPVARTGRLFNGVSTPAKALLDYHRDRLGPGGTLEMSPQFVIITERTRQHLELKTEYGTGPNPDQAFIITLDSSAVIPFEKVRGCGNRCGSIDKEENGAFRFGEIEIEFERNVSTGLDERLASAKEDGEKVKLLAAKEAFLSDQKLMLEVIRSVLAPHKITLTPAEGSKGTAGARLVKK